MAALNWEKFTLVTDDTIIIIIIMEEMRNRAKTIKSTVIIMVKCVGDMVQSFGNQGIQTDYSWNSTPKWRTNIIFFLFILLIRNHLWVFQKAEIALTKVALAISAFWKTQVQINSKLNKKTVWLLTLILMQQYFFLTL